MHTIGVIGSGTMGSGIAQVFAQAGYSVLLHDVHQAALDRARSGIEKSLSKFVEKGKLSPADRDAAVTRIAVSTPHDALAPSAYVDDAIFESD
jgi:3-hydroxybutyryl-CoA dehydrogenase